MHEWEIAYKNNKFSINTLNPSILVKKILPELPPCSNILDLGCGNGRNSIFLAEKGHKVDAIDVADLEFQKNIPEAIKNNVSFNKGSVVREFGRKSYDLIIATRLIQYLALKEVEFLFKQISFLMNDTGILLISYNTAGGIFNETDIKVSKYTHPIDTISKLLAAVGFKNQSIFQGSKVSRYVPYKRTIKSFDIIARKF